MNITPNQHEKNEWARLATDAYRTGRNFYGHRYSAKAALSDGAQLSGEVFDTLQHTYRQWLVFGWSEVESPK